jgi:Tfp pilus assembly protein PilW
VRRLGDMAGRLRRSEGGYTLIELLVAGMMGMIVLGAGVTVFIGAVRSEPRASSKVSAIEQGRIAVERMTRELRQGFNVSGASGAGLSFVTYVPQSSCGGSPVTDSKEPCRVIYQCAGGKCTRSVAKPDGSAPGAAVQVVGGLSSTNTVFSYSPVEPGVEPDYVGVTLSLTTREGGPVVVSDGAVLRNGGA